MRPTRAWRLAAQAASLIWLVACVTASEGVLPRQAQHPASEAAARSGGQAVASGFAAQGASQPHVVSLDRIPADQLRALTILCHRGPGRSGPFSLGGGEDVFGPVRDKPLTAAERRIFDREWEAAVQASLKLQTPAQVQAAGYVQAAPFNVGVGAHWIRWSQVSRLFDPATPSMLLFDGMPGRPVRLVGFAYWVQSDKQPVGFAGPNDQWHRHAGLCFSKDGWLDEQHVPDQASCRGYWLNGKNLWMLHAWVVPTFTNRWGRFAPTNPNLCPPPIRDILTCQVNS